jgi:hypothetical protein
LEEKMLRVWGRLEKWERSSRDRDGKTWTYLGKAHGFTSKAPAAGNRRVKHVPAFRKTRLDSSKSLVKG